ncbi:LOW QUALITY PROTEIN: hypothetical protein Cgig2_003575 [Carnegiea gigantea]|uniref:Uncharacterized protein n=1 Tax=Carnegiea gigantea TaxID=171969 RepID=A0A9Q1JX33_9CARY|nr:LOW QUALITY PROTEIN: hypothetical protein Cgig2_003575 [Carnegiea gigantea]
MPQIDTSALQGGDAKRIIKAKQALRKAHNSVRPSWSVTLPDAAKSRGAGWYEGQEESSQPRCSVGGGSEERVLLTVRFVGTLSTGTPAPGNTYPPSKWPVMVLVEAPRRTYIKAIEICTGDDFEDTCKRGGQDKGPQADKHPTKMRKELGVSTPPLRTSLWKSRAISC